MQSPTHDQVATYYGETLQKRDDLKTSACCIPGAIPEWQKPLLAAIPDAVMEKSYGCGSPIPPAIEGATVLDLGCGTGRDLFLCAQLVGREGRVIGVDMTAQQLEVARSAAEELAAKMEGRLGQIEVREGQLEDLGLAGIADESVDVVISNCVLNLSPDKERAFAEALRVLRSGGELYFSDVFCDRRLPPELMQDQVLLGECLAGALYAEDFRRLMLRLGVADVRTVGEDPFELQDREVADRIGFARFTSRTVRAFKLDLEDACEDYGQVATYVGGIPHHPHRFDLDDHHSFERGRPMTVCSNTASMLTDTRLSPFFRVDGDTSTHFGLFPCGPTAASPSAPSTGTPGACC